MPLHLPPGHAIGDFSAVAGASEGDDVDDADDDDDDASSGSAAKGKEIPDKIDLISSDEDDEGPVILK